MLQHHVLEVVDPGQVESCIRRAEHLMVAPQQADLLAIELDSASLQDQFQRLGSAVSLRWPSSRIPASSREPTSFLESV